MEIYNQLPCACVTADATVKIVNVNDTFLKYTVIRLPLENYNQINHLVNFTESQTEDPDTF